MKRRKRHFLTRLARTLALWTVGAGVAVSLIAEVLKPAPTSKPNG